MKKAPAVGLAGLLVLGTVGTAAAAPPADLAELVTLEDTSWYTGTGTGTGNVTPKAPWSPYTLRAQGRLSDRMGTPMTYAGTSTSTTSLGDRDYVVRESLWIDAGVANPQASVKISTVRPGSARRYIRKRLKDSEGVVRWRKKSVVVTGDDTTLITFPKRRIAAEVSIRGEADLASMRSAARYAGRVSREVTKRNRPYFKKYGTESFAWTMAIAFNGIPVVTGQTPFFPTENELAETFPNVINVDSDYAEVIRFVRTGYRGNGCVQIDAADGSMAPSVRITFDLTQTAGAPVIDMSYGACT